MVAERDTTAVQQPKLPLADQGPRFSCGWPPWLTAMAYNMEPRPTNFFKLLWLYCWVLSYNRRVLSYFNSQYVHSLLSMRSWTRVMITPLLQYTILKNFWKTHAFLVKVVSCSICHNRNWYRCCHHDLLNVNNDLSFVFCSMRTPCTSHLSKTTRILFGVAQLDAVNNPLP
jgi:hypothetical protein